MFDIDELGSYNDTFGRAAGDACIRRVAGVIGASFRRGADVVARWEGGLHRRAGPQRRCRHRCRRLPPSVARKVLDQHIHHPRAVRQKFVSGQCRRGQSAVRAAERSIDQLIQAATRALKRAKEGSDARIAVAQGEEIS